MTQLSVLANEIHEQAVADFKVSERFAYSFIMKVKRIRDERLYKELGFESFDNYCIESWSIKRDFMDQRIQIADSFGEPNFADTYRQLGHSKSLLLARMEPEIRQQIESTINVDEATVKKLKEAEKSLQESERRAAQLESAALSAQNSANHFEKLFNSMKNQPPVIRTQTLEVVPERTKKELDQLRFENTNLKHGFQEASSKLKEYELRQTDDFDAEQSRIIREKLQHEADVNTINVRIAFKQFVEKAAITSFLQGAIATATPSEKERLADMVEAAQQIIDQTKLALSGRRLGVVNG